jgi:hypothetical protein
VVWPYHPLEGRSLELIGCRRRGGKLELAVVLPDGSRRVIPAGWTDVWGAAVLRRAGTLGSIEDLLGGALRVGRCAARRWARGVG